MSEEIKNATEKTEQETPPVDPALLVQAFIAAIPLFQDTVKAWQNQQQSNQKTLLAHNKMHIRLWGKAVFWEGILIFATLFLGFGGVIALAIYDRWDSAEKIAFGLFGFIGGRGFLSVRKLIENGNK